MANEKQLDARKAAGGVLRVNQRRPEAPGGLECVRVKRKNHHTDNGGARAAQYANLVLSFERCFSQAPRCYLIADEGTISTGTPRIQ